MKANRLCGTFMNCEDRNVVQMNKIVNAAFGMVRECFLTICMNMFRLCGVCVVSGILIVDCLGNANCLLKISFRNLCLQTTYTVYACVVMHCTSFCLHRYIRSPFTNKQPNLNTLYIRFLFISTMVITKGGPNTADGTPSMRSSGASSSGANPTTRGAPAYPRPTSKGGKGATSSTRPPAPPQPSTPAPSNTESRGPKMWANPGFYAQYREVEKLLSAEKVPETAFTFLQWDPNGQHELNNSGYPVLSKERLLRDDNHFTILAKGKTQSVKSVHDTVTTVVLRPDKLKETLEWDRDPQFWGT